MAAISGEYAFHQFWPAITAAVEYNRPEIASYLLAQGVPTGLTATNQAIETRSTAIFDVLLQYGWDINQQSVGWLQRAVVWAGSVWRSFFWNYVENGIKDLNGRTVLECARWENHTEIEEMLRSRMGE